MIIEVLDPKSGAILFKKDKESITLEELGKELESLRKDHEILQNKVRDLESLLSK